MFEHLDDTGNVCARHPPAAPETLLVLAALGSRIPTFHHDAASKLQSLMMAIDEIGELADPDDAGLHTAATTAMTALRELNSLFTANRALGKLPQRTRVVLGDLVATAGTRSGMRVLGDLAEARIEVAASALTQALAIVLDLAAGAAPQGRIADVTLTIADGRARLTIIGVAPPGDPPPNASALLEIATFLIARDGGELRCISNGHGFTIALPVIG